MHVVITLTFDNPLAYENWLRSQAGMLEGKIERAAPQPEAEAAPDMVGGATETEAAPDAPSQAQREATSAKPPRKPRKPRKPRAPKAEATAAPAATTEPEVLPAAPVTEAAPTEGERVYTLADSREVLTGYLTKAGNGAESLLKELKVHGAKRINEVPQEHIHGFLKRMVEAS